MSNLVVDNTQTGWTNKITLHCLQDTDLKAHPIQFTLSKPVTISSMWGLPGKVKYTQSNNQVSVTVTQWSGDAAYVLPANQSVTLSFSASSTDFAIQAVCLGNMDDATPSNTTSTPDSSTPTDSTTLKPIVPSASVNNAWPQQAIVGYVKGYAATWKTQPDTTLEMIQAALQHGYNVLVYAFGGQDANNKPYLNFADTVSQNLPAQLQAIHNAKALALLSVGGGSNSTFNPSLNNGAEAAGKAMGEFIAAQGFDGLDIDVEHPNASTTADNLLVYIQAMRNAFTAKTGKSLILTAAPQVNGWYGSGQWASGDAKFAEPMYTQDFVNQAQFTAFLVQTYNQYGGANFAGLKGTDVGFLSMAFKLLSADTRAIMTGVPATAFKVPASTKIVLGVPNFKDPAVTDSEYKQGVCLKDATCSGVGLYKPADILKDISQITQYPQYGGIMTWIMNSDAYQNWSWVDGLTQKQVQPSTQPVVTPVEQPIKTDPVTIDTTPKTQPVISPAPALNKVIHGYWENWKAPLNPGNGSKDDASYYCNDIANMTHVFYSFLTLDKTPNPDRPATKHWDGQAIYESMTADNVITVMTKTDPAWENPDEWQRTKIAALIDATHNNQAKFIWSVGGWSDLTQTLQETQINTFVHKCTALLKLAGDGINFDWEHLSDDPSLAQSQRATMGKMMLALRQQLDKAGLVDKEIIYTTRFNAFMSNSKTYGFAGFNSDGEGLDISNIIQQNNSTLDQVISAVNIMAYDVPPSQMPNSKTWTVDLYKTMLDTFSKHVNPAKVVLGFEPGGQAAGGVWEGMNVDKQTIDYIQANGYGGIMFWAVNQPALPPSTENTGKNAQALAQYAKGVFK